MYWALSEGFAETAFILTAKQRKDGEESKGVVFILVSFIRPKSVHNKTGL